MTWRESAVSEDLSPPLSRPVAAGMRDLSLNAVPHPFADLAEELVDRGHSSREARSRRTRAPACGGGDRVLPAALPPLTRAAICQGAQLVDS
jgi:hypothetical protein